MSQRDCGWVQLYAQDNQDAVGLHVLAFRLAEQVSVPVMVCMDGFVLTHAFEPIELPLQADVDRFLPPFAPRQVLDPDAPLTIGAMVGPEAFTEVRYLADRRLRSVVDEFPAIADEFALATGHELSVCASYGTAGARTVVITLGSVTGTVQDAVADLPDVGVLALTLYRPFPADAVRSALEGVDHVIVLERAFAPGMGGVVSADVRVALAGTGTRISTVVAGLGGRPITTGSVRELLTTAEAGPLPEPYFLDLNTEVVAREVGQLEPRAKEGATR